MGMSKIRAALNDWTVENVLLWITIVISSMVILQYHKLSFFLVFLCLFCMYMILTDSGIGFQYVLINLIFISVEINAILPWFSDIPLSYQKNTRNTAIMFIPLYFFVLFLSVKLKNNKEWYVYIKNAIKSMALFQYGWMLCQFVFYHVVNVDLNDILFNRMLHFTENATFIREFVYYPSGLTHHSAVLAPLFVLALALFENRIIKLIIIFCAMICGNTTALFGVLFYYFIYIAYYLLVKMHFKVNIEYVCIFCLIVFVGFIVLWKSGMYHKIFDKIAFIHARIFSGADASAGAHKRYYTSYPQVLKISSPIQVFLGYGNGCSGYPISALFGQYASMKNWATESDIMNILLSRGILGFTVYYLFLFSILFKGYHLNFKYVAFMFAVLCEGITYNVQFEYVFMIECILFFSIKDNVDFFSIKSEKAHMV